MSFAQTIWLHLIVALVFSIFGSCASAASKPNIVLIMADDMGYECLGANGGEYSTPNLDALAKTGVRFEHCMANPLCTPSRVKIMTGLYNVRNYTRFGRIERDQTTFAHQLKKAGYKTCIAGKWQLGKEVDSPQHFGFEECCLWQHTRGRYREGTKIDPRYPNPLIEINGKEVDYTGGEYGPDVMNDFVLDFIERNQEGPFLVYYPMILVHCPFGSTPESDDWDPKSLGSPTYKGNPKYFGDMMTYADRMVGRVVEKLESLNLRDNTVILFCGDNGTDLPIKTNWNSRIIPGRKKKLVEAGYRVPMIASWPGNFADGTVVDEQLIDFTDVMPTLCELTGAPLPDNYSGDGVSFVPTLNGQKRTSKDRIYIWYKGEQLIRDLHHGVKRSLEGETMYLKYDGHYTEQKTEPSHSPEATQKYHRLEQEMNVLEKTRPAKLRKKGSQQ